MACEDSLEPRSLRWGPRVDASHQRVGLPPPEPYCSAGQGLLYRRSQCLSTPSRGGLRRRQCILGLLLASLLFPEPTQARVIAGVDLPDEVEVAGQALALRSCGVRDTLWVEHYVAAVYLPPDIPAASAMVDSNQPMVILLHITSTSMLPEQVPEQWREPLRKELSDEPLSKVREAYSSLTVGDRVRLDYSPKAGVGMSVNGTMVTTMSRGLIDSMLRTWAGEDQLTGKLQRLLLKHPC